MEYSIGEFSKLTGLGIHTLRYYEQEGLIAPERNSGNRRCYYDKDLTWIEFIKRLKDTGMLLKDIKEYSRLRYEGNATMPERLKMLEKHREYVLEQQKKWAEYLSNLDDKIVFYKDSIL